MSKKIGDVILDLQNISLRFGGVKALTDISFNVKQHEIRAIIGPNGAGKSSMLNVINGVYHPQEGKIFWHGKERKKMEPHMAAQQNIARTFQNIALFKGMSVLDNIMTGRITKMKANFIEHALWFGRARREELEHRKRSRKSSTSWKSSTSARPRSAACPTACKSGSNWAGRWRPSRRCCCSTSRWPA
jgi:branched-chain amino acid transport system ATP-binding protein